MTAPKTVSDFAREYEQTYLANVQLASAHEVLFKERDNFKRMYLLEQDARKKADEAFVNYMKIMQLRQEAVINFCKENGFVEVEDYIEKKELETLSQFK